MYPSKTPIARHVQKHTFWVFTRGGFESVSLSADTGGASDSDILRISEKDASISACGAPSVPILL